MSMSDVISGLAVGFFIGLFIGLFVSGVCWHSDKMKFRKEAIERGYAEYKTDSGGVTSFEWKGLGE